MDNVDFETRRFLCVKLMVGRQNSPIQSPSKELSQHYWQESFDGDSFVSQSRFDAYASCM